MLRVIKLNKKTWPKSYIDRNTELTKKAKNDFQNYFFKGMTNVAFLKTMENVRKSRDTELVTREKKEAI